MTHINLKSVRIISLSREETAKSTINIIDDAGTEGLIIGTTEDVPQNKWQENYMTIVQTIDEKFNVKSEEIC